MVILALSNTRDSPSAVLRATEEARRRRCPLLVCYIVDEKIPRSMASWLMYTGFLGEAPSQEVKRALLAELKSRAKDRLSEIGNRLKKEGISFSCALKEGNFFDILREICHKEKGELVVAAREKEALFEVPEERRLPCPLIEV